MSTNRNKLSVSAAIGRALLSIGVAGFLSACATQPPPLAANNPADPQVRSGLRTPRNLLTQDETTVAIERELRPTQAYAENAEKMEHDMQKMPGKQHEGMQHGGMQGMQHEGMNMGGEEKKEHTGEIEGHEGMRHGAVTQPEKKALADEMKKTSDEMKKTSDEMKKTSDEMKEKSEQTNAQGFYYTCRMHPQIHANKSGKCPICGMTLIKKEGVPPK